MRDSIALVVDMLGQAAAQNRMRMRPTDEKQLPTERRIIASQAPLMACCLLFAEESAWIVIENANVSATGNVAAPTTWILISPIETVEKSQFMTENEEIGRAKERSCIEGEETPEEASMSCHMAMRDQLFAEEELTVMGKVLVVVQEEQRYVSFSFLTCRLALY